MMKTNQLSNRRESPLDRRGRAMLEDANTRWQQVLTRDVTADGQFF
jgi:hypothetical protein